jgi:hypothetical protein
MREKRSLMSFIIAYAILICSLQNAAATSDSSIVYSEINLGGGLWQYDYAFNNTSNAGEYLYSVYLYFDQDAAFTGTSLPAGWDGIIWDGSTWTTSFADAYAADTSYDIAAGNSLGGFRFTVDYRAESVSYDAYFSDDSVVSGITAAVVPEPISSTLFIAGGLTLGLRRFRRKNMAA